MMMMMMRNVAQHQHLIVHGLYLFSRDVWYHDGRLLLIVVTLCVVLPLAMLPKIGECINPVSS